MKTIIQVLSQNEQHRIHEESLKILERTGVRVDTSLGRQILKKAGARVNENNKIVKFPKSLIESSLKQMTRDFKLSGRRPGADLIMNGGNSTLCLDGKGTMVLDNETGERRRANYADWQKITLLADALDEIGLYWQQVDPFDKGNELVDEVDYFCRVFKNFSKHTRLSIRSPEDAPWYIEILETIFGSKDEIRKNHPVSYLVVPQSPLIIDRISTDSYLALQGLDIPASIMTMPLMGATAPGTMISTIVLGNCEVLATICLLQANEPGVPIIYAPALAVINPKTCTLSYGRMEYSIMDTASTEMARYYGLPAKSSPGGSDSHRLDIQNAYESAAMMMPTAFSWPDIVVGAGMLDGSMVSSLEKIYMDAEVFRLAKHAHRGVDTNEEKWLMDVISKVGPGGNYLCEKSTVTAMRSEEWYISDFGSHETYESWEASDKKDILEEAREKVKQILSTHQPLPLDENVEKELSRICKRAEKYS